MMDSAMQKPMLISRTLRPKKGDCKQYFFTGRCSKRDSCPWSHDSTLYPDGKGKYKGKGKSTGKKGDGKSKRDSSEGAAQAERGRERTRAKSPNRIRQPIRGSSPDGERDRPICHLYLKNKCKKGNECPMWHSGQCKFDAQGKCLMGNRCIFLHPKPEPTPGAATVALQAAPSTPPLN